MTVFGVLLFCHSYVAPWPLSRPNRQFDLSAAIRSSQDIYHLGNGAFPTNKRSEDHYTVFLPSKWTLFGLSVANRGSQETVD